MFQQHFVDSLIFDVCSIDILRLIFLFLSFMRFEREKNKRNRISHREEDKKMCTITAATIASGTLAISLRKHIFIKLSISKTEKFNV